MKKNLAASALFKAILMALFLTSCKPVSNIGYTSSEIDRLHRLMGDRHFEISSQSAHPMTTTALSSVLNSGILPPNSNVGRIDLAGNANYIRIKGDSLQVWLPYFGEQRMSTGYGSTSLGIAMDNTVDGIKISFDENKTLYKVFFSSKTNMESLDFRIVVFPNLNSTIYVNSSHRTPISYFGTLRAHPDDND